MKKEPTLEQVQITYCILTCDCLNCEQQKDKIPIMEQGIAMKYCKERLGLTDDSL